MLITKRFGALAGVALRQLLIKSVRNNTNKAKANKPTAKSEIRTHKSKISPDLDWIVMKAIEKDRERRYPSASDLAADIVRHLKDEPVLASPPSRTYLITKFVKRHRTAVAAATAMALRLNGISHWMMWEVASLFEHIGTVQDGIGALAQPISIQDSVDASELQVSRGEVRFENLS